MKNYFHLPVPFLPDIINLCIYGNNGLIMEPWNDIPGQTSLLLIRNFTASMAPGKYDFRLLVAESGNINAVRCRVTSSPLSIVINANPVTAVFNNGPICEGDTLTLSSTGGIQYLWSGPNGYLSTGSPSSLANMQLLNAGKYYVDVTNAAGCKITDSTIVTVNPKPQAVSLLSSATICAGDSVQLTAGGGSFYEWVPSSGLSDAAIFNPKASPLATIEYLVIVTNQSGCTDTAFSKVTVILKPVANAGPDKIIIEGQQVLLYGSINVAGDMFSWFPGTFMNDIYSLEPLVNPPSDMEYVLKVTSNSGCGFSSDTVFVKVYRDIFIPNAFSPNADGMNDTWNIPALAAYPSFELSVYNRWGQKVFNTRNILKAWDGNLNGKPLPAGAYIYFINLGTELTKLKGIRTSHPLVKQYFKDNFT